MVSNFTWDRIAHNSGQRFSGGDRCGGALCGPLALRPKTKLLSAWNGVVFPSLLLNYFGQGALVLRDPSAHESPFFRMVPTWLGVATYRSRYRSYGDRLADIDLRRLLADDASGSNGLYVPFIKIRHTSHEEHGQIYISQINTLLALGCIARLLGFGRVKALASAYGVAVTLTMLATTLLLYLQLGGCGNTASTPAGALCAIPLAVEGAFFTGNSLKVLHGGWLPLAIGAVVFLQMTTWKKGRYLLRKNSLANAFAHRSDHLDNCTCRSPHFSCRVPGTAVYFSHNLKVHRHRFCTTSDTTACYTSAILCSQSLPIAYHTSKEARALKSKISLTGFSESLLTLVSWIRRR